MAGQLLAFSLLLALGAAPSPLEQATALLRQRRYEDALAAFQRAASEDQRCGECHWGMAEAQWGLGQAREAIASSERALQLGLPTPEAAGRVHRLRGTVLARTAGGRAETLAQAEVELLLALAAAPQDPNVLFDLGYARLAQRCDAEGVAQLEAYLARAPQGEAAQEARRLIQNPRRARERFAPAFSTALADGRTLSLDGLRGKVVILDFWATWCAPCRRAIPEIKELLRQYGERLLVVLSVSVDEDEQAWRTFLERNAMTWPQSRDAELVRLFGVQAFPTYIVLDGDGAIVQEIRGTDPRFSLLARLRPSLESLAAAAGAP